MSTVRASAEPAEPYAATGCRQEEHALGAVLQSPGAGAGAVVLAIELYVGVPTDLGLHQQMGQEA